MCPRVCVPTVHLKAQNDKCSGPSIPNTQALEPGEEREIVAVCLVINNNVTQKQSSSRGRKAKNCTALTVVTRIYYWCHIREGVRRAVWKHTQISAGLLIKETNEVFPASCPPFPGIQVTPLLHSTCFGESCPPKFLLLNMTSCPTSDQLRQVCLKETVTAVPCFNKRVEVCWARPHGRVELDHVPSLCRVIWIAHKTRL